MLMPHLGSMPEEFQQYSPVLKRFIPLSITLIRFIRYLRTIGYFQFRYV